MILTAILLFVAVGVLVIIHVCVVNKSLRRRDGDDTIPTITACNGGLKQVTEEDLKNLPCFNYKAAEEVSPIDCVVCLEHFRVGDSCRVLPNCNHSFHVVCIDSWVLKSPICPICRTRVYPTLVATLLDEESGASVDNGV
ncbi:hypothetical protein K2173_027031 [Erythroxylum novogranatense]|uniref:RING-type E3 ubiquitin transferase n=1 Tax=Erythroxylum novogranatense TaxID=1862640 RepID=A0AAV8U151_9ROSI|nr:hypothetical protein K2173_027031 [Erythroxylum novogranatense]